MKNNARLITHIGFWIGYLAFAFFSWELNYYEGSVYYFMRAQIGSLISNLLFFYAIYFFIIPHLLLKNKYILFTLAMLLDVAFTFLAKAYMWNGFQFLEGIFRNDVQIRDILFYTLMYGFVGTALSIYDHWNISENKKNKLQQEVKETEILYLKSQMSPHFLFNTLNNIYGLALNKDERTSLSIGQLKNLMLYVEVFESGAKILIQEEVRYLKSFIALHQLRNNRQVNFLLSLDQTSDSLQIEPMILLPFIENAFKHADNINNISIYLYGSAQNLFFKISNKVNTLKRKDEVGGIGIKNVERRLSLLYPGKHELRICHDNDSFTVELHLISS
ncbi:MAG: histidine kinase [Chitinophagaceae bacterium]|nr:histidine kinase [Chitinophagaceae bacterium]